MMSARTKILLLAVVIGTLGAVEVVHWNGQHGRAAGLGQASGIIAVLLGVGIAVYGLQLKEKK